MKMTGEQSIAVPRQLAWEGLNDPEVLRQCIPGCQSLEKDGEDRFKAVVAIKIGPIGARFQGAVTLADLDPPNGYTLVGEGQGGAAGFAKGSARVRLTEAGGTTLLSYEVDAQVGGRMAQLGGAVIDATAKQLAGTFFRRFGEVVAPPVAVTEVAPEAAAPLSGAAAGMPQAAPFAEPPAAASRAARSPAAQPVPMVWILAMVVCAFAGYVLGHSPFIGPASEWAGLAMGLAVLVAGAAGFEYGRRAAAPVIVLDGSVLERLGQLGSGAPR